MSELTSFGKLLIQQLNENLEKELEIRNLINEYSENGVKNRNQEENSNGNKNRKWCNWRF